MRSLALTLLLIAGVLGLDGCSKSNITEHQYVMEMFAAEDLPSGTPIKNANESFSSGKLHEKGKQPPGLFLDNWRLLTRGKKLSRELKKGEVVKRGDIVELDGTPFRGPTGFKFDAD